MSDNTELKIAQDETAHVIRWQGWDNSAVYQPIDSVTIAGWTLTVTPDGVELTAPKGQRLMRLEMVGEDGIKVRVK